MRKAKKYVTKEDTWTGIRFHSEKGKIMVNIERDVKEVLAITHLEKVVIKPKERIPESVIFQRLAQKSLYEFGDWLSNMREKYPEIEERQSNCTPKHWKYTDLYEKQPDDFGYIKK